MCRVNIYTVSQNTDPCDILKYFQQIWTNISSFGYRELQLIYVFMVQNWLLRCDKTGYQLSLFLANHLPSVIEEGKIAQGRPRCMWIDDIKGWTNLDSYALLNKLPKTELTGERAHRGRVDLLLTAD